MQECERALGATNPRIESLRTLVFFAGNNVKEAYISVHKYFQLADGRFNHSTAHKELMELRSVITARLKEEDEKYKKDVQQARMREAEKEIRQAEELVTSKTDQLKSESEKVLFEKYNRSDDPAHLDEYVKIYGTSGRGKTIKNRADYLRLVASGDRSFQHESYETAVNQYKKAQAIYSPDSLRKKLAIATEERDFQTAIQSNQLDHFLYYHKTYPEGRHINHVSNSILRYHLQEAEVANRKKEFARTEGQLKEASVYVSKAGPKNRKAYYDMQLQSAKAMESHGKLIQKNKWYFNLVRSYYQSYDSLYGAENAGIKKHINKLNKQYRRIHGHGNHYFAVGVRADENAWIGLDLVDLKHRGLGFGISARANPFMFENTLGENETYNIPNNVKGNHVTAYGNLIFTKKVIHPVWLYAGGGIASYSRIENLGTDDAPQKAMTTKNIIMPNAEGGIYITLKPMYLSAGISMPVVFEKNKPILNIQENIFVPHISLGFVF